jgi:4'-phosphopantetheinyl transferase
MNNIHIWRAALDLPAHLLEQLAGILSHEERSKATRFYYEQDRNRFIVSHGILRMILSHYLVEDPVRIEICYPARGKPYLASVSGGDAPRFNVSHSYNLALLAFAQGREVGVDLEYIDPIQNIELIATRLFSADEQAAFQALPNSQKLKALYACWTRKEAYLKAIGAGLTRPLENIEVSFAPDEPAQLLETLDDVGDSGKWSLMNLSPAPDFAAALAVEGQDWHLSCWEYSPFLDPAPSPAL